MKAFLLIAMLTLAACGESFENPKPDQCLRREIFKECMAALPKGPQTTHYNDWDEVVSECEKVGYYESLRKYATIKPECRS